MTITRERFDEYKKLRWDPTVTYGDWDAPAPASSVMHRWKAGANTTYKDEKKALALDLDWSDSREVKPYGGFVSNLHLDPEKVIALGFDPQHLTAKVFAALDDWDETVEAQLKEMGYEVVNDDDDDHVYRGNGRYEQIEEKNRPNHWSVRVDFSGPRDRSDPKWVYVNWKSVRYFTDHVTGAAKQVFAEVRQRKLLRAAEDMAKWVRGVFSGDIQNHTVQVKVYWRGEEIGESMRLSVELDASSRKAADGIADVILGNDLLGAALDEACKWADDAVRDAMARAAREARSIALLPERARKAEEERYIAEKQTTLNFGGRREVSRDHAGRPGYRSRQ